MALPTIEEKSPFGGLIEGLTLSTQQTIPTIAEMIGQHRKGRQQQELIRSILGGIEPQQRSAMDSMGLGSQQQEPLITPEKIIALESAGQHDLARTLTSLYGGQEKERMKQQKLQEETKIGQDAFNRMSELLRGGKLGAGSKLKGKLLGGETAEAVGEFESLSGALESMLVDRVSRGTLSNARFQYITEVLLPKPNDREATIKGKLKALARELNLDVSALTTKKAEPKLSSKDFVLMKDPDGVTRKIPKNKAAAAQKAGGKLVR